MSFVKFNTAIYMLPVMREIKKPTHPRDGFMLARESIFFKLLAFCADGHKFTDAKQFAKIAMLPLAQTELVWDMCIKLRILREVGAGYTTINWCDENDLIYIQDLRRYTYDKPVASEQTQPDNSPSENTTKAVSHDNEPPCEVKYKAPTKRRYSDIPKEYVRPNVRLTRDEIEKLKEEFTDDEIAAMVDKLSEYKTQSHREYASDYDAITRWGVKWLRDQKTQSKSITTTQDNNFPNWVTGKL